MSKRRSSLPGINETDPELQSLGLEGPVKKKVKTIMEEGEYYKRLADEYARTIRVLREARGRMKQRMKDCQDRLEITQITLNITEKIVNDQEAQLNEIHNNLNQQ